MFREAGKGAIEGTARCVIDQKNSWGDIDVIYLTFGDARGTFGWPPPGPVKITQTKEGDVPGVQSSQEEPPVEELPPPPAVSKDGTVEGEQEHHSITVTGTWRYWTKLGDYRVNPDEPVPAEIFLVELASGSGAPKAYGYTDSDGNFSISGVDPSSGNVYVSDRSNNRIQKFDSSGTFITKWGSYGTGDGQFRYPSGVAEDSSGNVYVADEGNHRIQKIGSY